MFVYALAWVMTLKRSLPHVNLYLNPQPAAATTIAFSQTICSMLVYVYVHPLTLIGVLHGSIADDVAIHVVRSFVYLLFLKTNFVGNIFFCNCCTRTYAIICFHGSHRPSQNLRNEYFNSCYAYVCKYIDILCFFEASGYGIAFSQEDFT